jgi:hypothetical protein
MVIPNSLYFLYVEESTNRLLQKTEEILGNSEYYAIVGINEGDHHLGKIALRTGTEEKQHAP